MKVVKLDRRHKLYHKGFTYAFQGAYATDNSLGSIVRYYERIYGDRNLSMRGPWYSGFGKGRTTVHLSSGGSYTTNPYMIAVRNEADITAAVLATGVELESHKT